MIKHVGNGLYDVYTRDNTTKVAEGLPFQEALKILCKTKEAQPKWVAEIERKRENAKIRHKKPN